MGPESASIEIPPFRSHISKVVFFRLTKKKIREQKKFVQGTTFVQFFMYWKAKKNFGVIRKIFKIFIFQNLLNVFLKPKNFKKF